MNTQICLETTIYARLAKGKRTAQPEHGGPLGVGPLSVGGEVTATQAVLEPPKLVDKIISDVPNKVNLKIS